MRRGVPIVIGAGATVLFAFRPDLFAPLLRPFAPVGGAVIYPQASLWSLALSHVGFVLASLAASFALGFALAVAVTRGGGRVYLPMARALVSGAQCFPPVAVLALLVPVLGFGGAPLVWALFLYGLLPIFENALRGLDGIAPEVREAGRGMGLTPWRRFREIDLPLSLPFVLLGLRLSLVVSISTAALGSTVGARTLGEVVIAGLSAGNVAFVLQGAVLVTALSVLGYAGLGLLAGGMKR